MFDEDLGTVQSPGVRAGTQCFKLAWRVSERQFIAAFAFHVFISQCVCQLVVDMNGAAVLLVFEFRISCF